MEGGVKGVPFAQPFRAARERQLSVEHAVAQRPVRMTGLFQRRSRLRVRRFQYALLVLLLVSANGTLTFAVSLLVLGSNPSVLFWHPFLKPAEKLGFNGDL